MVRSLEVKEEKGEDWGEERKVRLRSWRKNCMVEGDTMRNERVRR